MPSNSTPALASTHPESNGTHSDGLVVMGKEQPTVSSPAAPKNSATPSGRGLSSWGGFGILAVGTTLAGFLEMSLAGALGWLTGGVFTILCALVALGLRRQDLTTAVISPPLAYLFAVIVSAQVAVVGSSGNFWLLEATTILSGLAFNAQWVFLGTGLALAIMAMRRILSRKQRVPAHSDASSTAGGRL